MILEDFWDEFLSLFFVIAVALVGVDLGHQIFIDAVNSFAFESYFLHGPAYRDGVVLPTVKASEVQLAHDVACRQGFRIVHRFGYFQEHQDGFLAVVWFLEALVVFANELALLVSGLRLETVLRAPSARARNKNCCFSLMKIFRIDKTIRVIGQETCTADVGARLVGIDAVLETHVVAHGLVLLLEGQSVSPRGQRDHPFHAKAFRRDEAQIGFDVVVAAQLLPEVYSLLHGVEIVDVEHHVGRTLDEPARVTIREGTREERRLEVQLLVIAQFVFRGVAHHLAQRLGGLAGTPLAGNVLVNPRNILILLGFRGQHRLAVTVSITIWKDRKFHIFMFVL